MNSDGCSIPEDWKSSTKSGDEIVVSRTRLVTYGADDSTVQRDHELENGEKRIV